MYNSATNVRTRHRSWGVPAMVRLVRRSLLLQLLGVYLLFVGIVLASGMEADIAGQQQLKSEIQTTDLALAQEVALETYTRINNVETALVEMSPTVASDVNNGDDMTEAFNAFKIARFDVDGVYWLDASGVLRVSVPANFRTLGEDFSNDPNLLFQRAENNNGPVVGDGTVDLTTFHAVVSVAEPVRDNRGQFLGVLVANLQQDSLGTSLRPVIAAQATQGQHLIISILDDRGRLISSPERALILQPIAAQLPGATDALAGHTATNEGAGPNRESWLYSAAPVPALGWAVVVQRPTSDLAAATSNFSIWLLVATGLFAVGGLLFWLVLVRRVVRPLHALAAQNVSFSGMRAAQPALTTRPDELGGLARSLERLNHDVNAQLAELRTLLETSNAVVNSLDPSAVGHTIIREVRRLVDVQAAAVLVPDDQGTLRVLVSEGRADNYGDLVHVRPDQLTVPSARALHDGRPVQLIDDGNPIFPTVSASEGFRAVLAIPIISQRVGGVVLVVHRREPQPFTENEVDLLLTFANYATLAWEHAVLYERSDERLREVAHENERLYRQANAEKQTLSAIMGSISDGLLLTGMDGRVLYANPGARALIGQGDDVLDGYTIAQVHSRLQQLAKHPGQYDSDRRRVEAGELDEWLLETTHERQRRAFNLRLFDVRDEAGDPIGYGLLLRDVTRERELDQFKTALLAAVGHELRTPLAVIKGHASTLLQEDVTWPVEDQHHFLRTISAEADQLAQLVSSLLDLSRSEAGLLMLKRAPHHLAHLVEAAVRRLNMEIPSLTVELPDDLPAVDVDASRVEVVIHNLLVNSAKYGDGVVCVRASVGAGNVLVRIADNGPGISPDDVPHIFERFYRAQHAPRQQLGGTGLGLAICKAFVEAHGGTIWVESDSAGTSFTFTLPTAAAVSAPADEAVPAYSGRGTA